MTSRGDHPNITSTAGRLSGDFAMLGTLHGAFGSKADPGTNGSGIVVSGYTSIFSANAHIDASPAASITS
jgi:hypothetical protein